MKQVEQLRLKLLEIACRDLHPADALKEVPAMEAYVTGQSQPKKIEIREVASQVSDVYPQIAVSAVKISKPDAKTSQNTLSEKAEKNAKRESGAQENVKPEKPVSAPKKRLTGKQEEALIQLISYYEEHSKPARLKEIRTKSVKSGSLNYLMQGLIDHGYAKQQSVITKNRPINSYIPVRRPDGSYMPGHEPKAMKVSVENGVKVTKCPPAYAEGFGIQPSAYEVL